MKVTKAVFPVAGLGTRFLPATKATPKEMLPIVDKPLIQYAVEEAIEAGINELIFVTSYTKRAIEDHFDRNFELETRLQEQHKYELLEMVRNIIPEEVSCVYIRQTQQLGLGHAVLCAQPLIKDEPFAVLLADDLINQELSCLQAMLQKFAKVNSSIIAVEAVSSSEISSYGVIGLADNDLNKPLIQVIEKPTAKNAPSNFGIVGRYVLTPEIFSYLAQAKRGAGGEIQLTDAIAELMQKQLIYAYQIEGTRYDCGSKLGYLKAIVEYGLKHEELGNEFTQFLQKIQG